MKAQKKAIRHAIKGKPIRQVAAIPVRVTDGGELQVMLITSRTTRRFIVPKGWPMKRKSSRKAAALEARDEAGIAGRVLKAAAGGYRYWKRIKSGFVLVEVTAYLLAVEHVLEDWKESHERARTWLAPKDAAALIDEPALAALLNTLTVDSVVLAA
ncbi:NUDIX hydrolase [Pseudaminobacter soli (ex Li et al. 2025)]|uniref:NUDIX hydrolase n=1 Tax=Pseudaminobacter soli (ex Li et al. 2025) TaxID=1295366 RepID=A0A2P7RME1_9HYPH|nr:NUDIX hydrolase [Mesorhizobium soli]PSJ51383.1 NUDIX hydrolase [Mesorhizobium soli]